MKIKNSYPPNIKAIQAAFAVDESTVFTYGDTLYNPAGHPISQDLLAHEQTHQDQQGNNPAGWWEVYLNDQGFRLVQELEAYRRQYNYAKTIIKDRNALFRFLVRLASDLSSPMYGSIITRQEAMNQINNG